MGKLVDKLMKVINFLISQWFIIGMGVAVAIAYAAPNYARSGGMIRSDITIEYLAVAAIFLISGLSMPSRTLLKELGNWRAHLITQGLSFLVTPALMFGFVKAIYAADDPRIDKYVLVGMIICGCTPTTVSSNVVMTRNAGETTRCRCWKSLLEMSWVHSFLLLFCSSIFLTRRVSGLVTPRRTRL